MRVTIYPSDRTGCGHFRLIWPAQELARQGHNVEIRPPDARDLRLRIEGNRMDRDAHVYDVLDVAGNTDVVVFQRLTHEWMAQAVPILRRKGVAVVVDVDDDLTSVHPRNPAYTGAHPKNVWNINPKTGEYGRNSWRYLMDACRNATLVTVSTPSLLEVFGKHGNGRVIMNHLPAHYYGIDREDNDRIGWPAYLPSHPDDPSAVGGAVARLCADPSDFQVVGDPTGCGAAFGLVRDPSGQDRILTLDEWPGAVAKLGIGVAPLADTRFNHCKSWLKPLEMAAVGVPWVGSPRTEYARLHRRGCGVMADTPRRWHRELKRLQDSPAMRSELSAAGREVAEGIRLEPNAWRWLEAWTEAYDLEHAVKPARAIPV